MFINNVNIFTYVNLTHVHYVSSSYCIGENYDSLRRFLASFLQRLKPLEYTEMFFVNAFHTLQLSTSSRRHFMKVILLKTTRPVCFILLLAQSFVVFLFWVRRKMRRKLSCGFDMDKTKCDLSVCLNFLGFSSILQYPLWSETYSSIIILNKLATFEKGKLITAKKYFENLFNPMAVECL